MKAAFSSFQIDRLHDDIPLDISSYNGILYTTGSLMAYSNKTLKVNIQGQPIIMPFGRHLDIRVDVFVQPTALSPIGDCGKYYAGTLTVNNDRRRHCISLLILFP